MTDDLTKLTHKELVERYGARCYDNGESDITGQLQQEVGPMESELLRRLSVAEWQEWDEAKVPKDGTVILVWDEGGFPMLVSYGTIIRPLPEREAWVDDSGDDCDQTRFTHYMLIPPIPEVLK